MKRRSIRVAAQKFESTTKKLASYGVVRPIFFLREE